MVKAIFAMDPLGSIGKDNDLPWRNDPDTKWDLKHFKDTTILSAVYMGWKTYESLPKALPFRLNIVENTHGTKDIKDRFTSVESLEKLDSYDLNKHDIYIIGGAKLFEKYKNKIDECIVTIWDKEYPGDTYIDLEWLNSFPKQETLETHENGIVARYFK